MDFRSPPTLENSRGETRCAGFEIEYTGVKLELACDLIREIFGGEIRCRNRFHYEVTDTRFGDFKVEVDWLLLKDQRYRSFLQTLGIDDEQEPEFGASLESFIEDVLMRIAEIAVPFEIVTPPIPMAQLSPLEALRQRLCDHQGPGTGASLFYGFGLHINPETPDLSCRTVLAHLRAYLLLEEAKAQENDPDDEAPLDFTRVHLLPYIQKFPSHYVVRVLDPEYRPDMEGFIDDYLHDNPTRNRPLDLLPILACEHEARVWNGLPEDQRKLVRARPAFHFRMPDCRLDDPQWSIAQEWNRWVDIEDLARDTARLRAMSEAFLDIGRDETGGSSPSGERRP